VKSLWAREAEEFAILNSKTKANVFFTEVIEFLSSSTNSNNYPWEGDSSLALVENLFDFLCNIELESEEHEVS